jgi:2-oxo-4-hydroxy-4-carboxy-5-ureidoimidazoline decarboxylase
VISPERIAALNTLSETDALAAFLRCCGSKRWAHAMASARPYENASTIFEMADSQFATLTEADWLEAFAHHPRIGDVSKLRERFAHSGDLSEREQGTAMSSANNTVIEALFRANQHYEALHGHIFIVCASGKSASEMLDILESRIDLEPAEELVNCAAEQKKITALRLQGI